MHKPRKHFRVLRLELRAPKSTVASLWMCGAHATLKSPLQKTALPALFIYRRVLPTAERREPRSFVAKAPLHQPSHVFP